MQHTELIYCKDCGHRASLHPLGTVMCFGIIQTTDREAVACDCESFEAVTVDLMYAAISVVDERVLV